jgi:hypothetical protein
VAKLALFVYNRRTWRPLWQSGAVPEESKAKALWVFGAGPFQRGSIYRGTKFAGDHVSIPLIDPAHKEEKSGISVADEAFFVEPADRRREFAEIGSRSDAAYRMPDDPVAAFGSVVQTSHVCDGPGAPCGFAGPQNGPIFIDPSPSGPAVGSPTLNDPGPRAGGAQPSAGPAEPPSTTSAGYGSTVPAINLPGQLPFGVNTPWTQDASHAQSATSDLHLNPFGTSHR